MTILNWLKGEITFFEISRTFFYGNRVEEVVERFKSQQSRFLFVNVKNPQNFVNSSEPHLIFLLHYKNNFTEEEKDNIRFQLDKMKDKVQEINTTNFDWNSILTPYRREYLFSHNDDQNFQLLTAIILFHCLPIGTEPFRYLFIDRFQFTVNNFHCTFGHFLLPILNPPKNGLFLPSNLHFGENDLDNTNNTDNMICQLLKLQESLRKKDWDFYFHYWGFLYPTINSHPCYTNLIENKKVNLLHMGCHLGTDLNFLSQHANLDPKSRLLGFYLENNLNSDDSIKSLAKRLYGTPKDFYTIFGCYFLHLANVKKYIDVTDERFNIVYIDGLFDSLSLDNQKIVLKAATICLEKGGHLIGRVIVNKPFPVLLGNKMSEENNLHTSETLKELLLEYFPKVVCPMKEEVDPLTSRHVLYFECSN